MKGMTNNQIIMNEAAKLDPVTLHAIATAHHTPEQIAAFKAEMDQAGADYRFVELPGAKHGFSNPDADAHKGHGLDLGYQKEADERSWADMQALFKDVF